MRLLLMIFSVCFSNQTYSQTSQIDDNLLADICKSIEKSKVQNDSLRVFRAFDKHLSPILRNMNSAQAEDAWNSVFFRLQRNCPSFKSILDRNTPQKGDWQTINSKPISQMGKSDCNQFRQTTTFSYLEASGDTVHVTLDNGFWIDRFNDGTFSKLKLEWVGDCSFVIEFIESNNLIRKNFSKAGDRYSYEVLNKGNRYYDMAVNIVGTSQFSTFKLYY